MNENYSHPEMPKDKNCEEGILKGMYKIKEFNKYKKTKIQLLGSGTILREMMSAAEILQNDYQIDRFEINPYEGGSVLSAIYNLSSRE